MDQRSVLGLALAVSSFVLTPWIIPGLTLSPAAIVITLMGLIRSLKLNSHRGSSLACLLLAIGVQIFQLDAYLHTRWN
ncbi:hypothetical protein [Dyella silvatica]|uniref:hypothetical protein n=1 Tax=Dyella silvatica TaxID=2992128 RepID=UPI00225AA8F1|nr:hypothetical protein [Dyella silvatica]